MSITYEDIDKVSRPLSECRLPAFVGRDEQLKAAALKALTEGSVPVVQEEVKKSFWKPFLFSLVGTVLLGGLLTLLIAVPLLSGSPALTWVLFGALMTLVLLGSLLGLFVYSRQFTHSEELSDLQKSVKENFLWQISVEEVTAFRRMKSSDHQEEGRRKLAELNDLREAKSKLSLVGQKEQRERLMLAEREKAQGFRAFVEESLRQEALADLPEVARKALAEPVHVEEVKEAPGVFTNYPEK